MGFVNLHQNVDFEVVSLRANTNRHENQIHQIARHVNFELKD